MEVDELILSNATEQPRTVESRLSPNQLNAAAIPQRIAELSAPAPARSSPGAPFGRWRVVGIRPRGTGEPLPPSRASVSNSLGNFKIFRPLHSFINWPFWKHHLPCQAVSCSLFSIVRARVALPAMGRVSSNPSYPSMLSFHRRPRRPPGMIDIDRLEAARGRSPNRLLIVS